LWSWLSINTSDFDVALRRAVYDDTLRAGRPPTSTQVAQALESTIAAVQAGFQRLAAAHVLVLQPETGEILMANPFSAVPTPFPVTTADQNYYGNCIWDALGIAAMLNVDAAISTACGCCGLGLEVGIKAGVARGPSSLVHFALPAARWWDDIVFT
jgi:hypothetical protein